MEEQTIINWKEGWWYSEGISGFIMIELYTKKELTPYGWYLVGKFLGIMGVLFTDTEKKDLKKEYPTLIPDKSKDQRT